MSHISNTPLKVGIIGLGLVGKELIKQLNTLEDFELVGIMNSKKQLINPSGIPSGEVEELLSLAGVNPSDIYQFMDDVSAIEGEKVLIDCTSNEEIASLYPLFLESGFHVVTPNKKAFSSDLELFKTIEASKDLYQKQCLHESTVGAGLPVLETLKSMVRSGDKIKKIEGVFSGTLSYIFNEFSKTSQDGSVEKGFSDIVKVAKDLGYTVSLLFILLFKVF